jgi:predicted RNase H-like nuclease (RuvC/YqgF family)
MNEDQIYNINWGDYTIATTNPQGMTALSYYIPENNYSITTVKYDGAISVQDEMVEDIKKMKRHISDMQTEINNLRAENQLLRNSLKDFVNEMKKIILKKEKNNE